MSAFADTSFLVSLYIPDAHSSAAVVKMKRAALPVVLSSVVELEFLNALSLRLYRKEASPSEIAAAIAAMRRDVEAGVFRVEGLSNEVLRRASEIARKHTPRLGTRTLDILHVASAAGAKSEVFYTFDSRQARLARAEGMKTP